MEEMQSRCIVCSESPRHSRLEVSRGTKDARFSITQCDRRHHMDPHTFVLILSITGA